MKKPRPNPALVIALMSAGAILLTSCASGVQVDDAAGASTTFDTSTTSSTANTVPTTTTASTPVATEPSTAQASVTQVEIDAGDLTLVGDLYLPAGSGPHPGIVLVHGSGPQSRRSELSGQLNMAFGFTIPVFVELAEGFQSAGYAVLTYDKRTCGRFNGCTENDYPLPAGDLTIETLIGDAKAALDTLAQRPDVDGQRLVAIGHSQGAGFVPELMDGEPGIVAGVLLAGAHDAPDALVAAQARSTRELLESLGTAPGQVDEAVAPLDEAAAKLEKIRQGEPPEELILGAPASFWESWMAQADDVPTLAAHLDRPLLVLGGELDWNVPPDQAMAWEETLAGSTEGHQVTVLPCITHALNCVAESDPAQISPDDIGTDVAPEVIEAIVTFLDAQT